MGGWDKRGWEPHGIYLTLTDNKWHFLTSTRSGTTHTLYGDGVTNKVSNTISAAVLPATAIAIGSWNDLGNSSQVFKGSIPQVLIYNRALSEAEIMQNYNSVKAKFGK
jgi:hypothetical protein